MNKVGFSGHVIIEVYDTQKKSVVYKYESDNKIVRRGLEGYGRGWTMLPQCKLGRGFVNPPPRNPDGSPQSGWYTADDLFWFYEYPAQVTQSGIVSHNVPTPPSYRWKVLSPAYIFPVGSFDGDLIDCVFIKNSMYNQVWSVVDIPQFRATRNHLITVYYVLTVDRDTREISYTLDLGASQHTVTCKPARILTELFTQPYMTLELQRARVWHYTDVTSLGDITGELNGTNFNCGGFYRDYTFAPFVDTMDDWQSSREFYDEWSVGQMNCAPNGISGFLLELRYPTLYTQYKIDPPIMKDENMKVRLSLLYRFWVNNIQVG